MFGDKENNNYISLQEATKYCSYTQEYLSLRARQERLKAVKIGRNWVTTKDWLDDYLDGIMEYSNNFKNGRKIPEKKEEIKREIIKEILPPENLPIGEIKLTKVKPFYIQFIEVISSPSFRFGAVFLVTLFLIISAAFFEKDSFQDIMAGASKISSRIEYRISKIETKINEDEIYSAAVYGTINTYKEYFQWIGDNFSEIIAKAKNSPPFIAAEGIFRTGKKGYSVIDELLEKKISDIANIFSDFYQKLAFGVKKTTTTEQGLVVFPTAGNGETEKKIKAAFSDEVEVKPKDKTSGVIIPIFREGKGEEYIYVLVPVKSENK